jgi:alpha-mannosidase
MTQDWGRHEFTYGIYAHENSWRDASSYWQGRRFNQPMKTFEAATHAGQTGKAFSMLSCSTDQVDIMAFKKMQTGDKYIVRMHEIAERSLENAILTVANGISSAVEVDGQEKEIGPAVIKNGKLVFGMKANGIRSFALTLKPCGYKLETPVCRPAKLQFNCDVISSDCNRADGRFGQTGNTIPAELFPHQLTSSNIEFQLGSCGINQNNAVKCCGQEIELPKGGLNRVYLLASADEDTAGIFRAGDNSVRLDIQAWTGFIGQFDKRIWPGNFAPIDFKGKPEPVSIRTGFIKRGDIAWVGTHRHGLSGNQAYQFCYIYKFGIDLYGSNKLILPDNPKIKVFAVTAACKTTDNLVVSMPLYDDFSNRPPVQLRVHDN